MIIRAFDSVPVIFFDTCDFNQTSNTMTGPHWFSGIYIYSRIDRDLRYFCPLIGIYFWQKMVFCKLPVKICLQICLKGYMLDADLVIQLRVHEGTLIIDHCHWLMAEPFCYYHNKTSLCFLLNNKLRQEHTGPDFNGYILKREEE